MKHLLFFSTIVFICFFNQSYSNEIRLDELSHDRYQLFGTCYANVAVDLIDSYRHQKQNNSKNFEKTEDAVFGSSLLVSIFASEEKYMKSDKEFLYSWHKDYPDTIKRRPLDGGRICSAIKTIRSNGLYSYESIEKVIFDYLGIDYDGSSKHREMVEEFFFTTLKNIYIEKNSNELRNIFPHLGKFSSIKAVYRRHYLGFLSSLFQGIGKKIFPSYQRFNCKDKKINKDNKDQIKKFIMYKLQNEDSTSIAINFHSSLLKDNFNKDETNVKKGNHVVSIVGKRINEKKEVEVLIKDTTFLKVRSDYKLEEKDFRYWIKLDTLLNVSYRLSYLVY